MYTDTFEISLRDGEALVQEIRMPAAPLGVFRLRLANRDPDGRPGGVHSASQPRGYLAPSWPADGSSFRREPARCGGACTFRRSPRPKAGRWPYGSSLTSIRRPNCGSARRIRTGTRAGGSGSNGVLAWPDQDLEFVAYSAAAPTPSKFEALWRLIASDWRWPVLAVGVAIALTLITVTPALLLASALPRGRFLSNHPG